MQMYYYLSRGEKTELEVVSIIQSTRGHVPDLPLDLSTESNR
jgi:hypothetical protein